MTKKIFFLLFVKLFLSPYMMFGQSVSDSIIDGIYIKEMTLINGKYEYRVPNPVRVKLINSTGYDIDTLIFYGKHFPKLEKDSSTTFFDIPNYVNWDYATGNILNLKIDNANWVWNCKGVPFNYEHKTLILDIVLVESKFRYGYYRMETRIKETID